MSSLIKLQDYTNYNIVELKEIVLDTKDAEASENTDNQLDEYINLLRDISRENVIVLPKDSKKNQEPNFLNLIQRSINGYQTQCYVGLLQLENGRELFIGSRFDEKDNYYFTQYILSKAYNLKVSLFQDMKPQTGKGQFIEFLLIFVFLYQINKAYSKGIYRQYCTFECNDAKLKGKIDIARHIRLNSLFNGKIAYSYREYTISNNVNRLILTAYSWLEKSNKQLMRELTWQYKNIAEYIKNLKNIMQPFSKQEISKVISRDRKKITHSVYRDWENVRKTAIMILRHMGIDIAVEDEHRTNGILIDMRSVWELYIESILKSESDSSFAYKIKTQEETKYLFSKTMEIARIRTDFEFYKDENSDEPKLILDAKYKNEWQEIACNPNSENKWPREDVFQMLAYMYLLKCDYGGIVCPLKKGKMGRDEEGYFQYDLKNRKEIRGEFFIIPIVIPQVKSQEDFMENMKISERKFFNAVKEVLELIRKNKKDK